MPFAPINWNSVPSVGDSLGNPTSGMGVPDLPDLMGATVGRMKLFYKATKCMGIKLDYKVPKKKTRAYWAHLHRGAVSLLLLCVCAPPLLLMPWRAVNWSAGPLTTQGGAQNVLALCQCLLYVQAAVATLGLAWIMLRDMSARFESLLRNSTSAIGDYRHPEIVAKSINIVHIFCASVFTLLIAHFFVSRCLPTDALPINLAEYLPRLQHRPVLFLPQLDYLLLFIQIYLLLGWWLAHYLFALTLCTLCAELVSLNADMRTDSNLYQLAVAKHYCQVHCKLRRILHHCTSHMGLGHLSTLILGTSTITGWLCADTLANHMGHLQLSHVAALVPLPDTGPAVPLVLCLALGLAQAAGLTVLVVAVERLVNKIGHTLGNLCASERHHLEPELYALTLNYNLHLRQSDSNGVRALGGLIGLDRKLAVMMIGLYGYLLARVVSSALVRPDTEQGIDMLASLQGNTVNESAAG